MARNLAEFAVVHGEDGGAFDVVRYDNAAGTVQTLVSNVANYARASHICDGRASEAGEAIWTVLSDEAQAAIAAAYGRDLGPRSGYVIHSPEASS